MPRKDKKLCSYRNCKNERKTGYKWCYEHHMARWDESELTIDRGVMREVIGKVHLLAAWNEQSSEYIHDLCIILKRMLIEAESTAQRSVDPTWMFLFEAEKWQDSLFDDANSALDHITGLIYPEGKGR